MEEKCLNCITREPETCFKTDDGYYIHDGEVFYRVLPNYFIERCEYKSGNRVFDKAFVLARFKDYDNAAGWVIKNKPINFFVDDAGNKVFNGDVCWFVSDGYRIYPNTYVTSTKFNPNVKARFKNKSDAEAWVKNNKPFEPFELSIPIKTKEDLKHLWHRLNIPVVKVENHEYGYDTGVENPTSGYSITDMWSPVDMKIRELGLKK